MSEDTKRGERRIFVISDLHLGGRSPDASAGDQGFQMCSAVGQRRLASWVAWCKQHLTSDRHTEIVIAGDIVDFLSEEPFVPFTADDATASGKLNAILQGTSTVWDNLASFVEAGGELTLMLGNHDVELSLPGPRRILLDRLGRARAPRFNVDFIDDNRARVEGPVIIEHGNRYDAWNAVPHDKLRAVRSAISRGELDGVPHDLGMPGSHLVTKVMNPIKARYRFVDLLKPEAEAALPIVGAIAPEKIAELRKLVPLAATAASRRRTQFSRDTGAPTHAGYIATSGAGWSMRRDNPHLVLAEELAKEHGFEPTSASNISVSEHLGRLREFTDSQLYRALRAFSEAHELPFAVNHEVDTYRIPAEALAQRFNVVVFGHTHLAKRVPLSSGKVYLNTGTWADLMRLPPSILDGSSGAEGEAELKAFAQDLRENELERHVRQLPTFAQIDLGSGGAVGADVYLFKKDGAGAAPVPERSLWEIWDDYGEG